MKWKNAYTYNKITVVRFQMSADASSASRSAIKILLVEDDEPTLELLSLFLARFYSIVSCSSGERALNALYTISGIDLIVTDLRMPAVNGFLILRCAAEYSRRTGKPLPTIVLTGHGTPEDESKARSLGVTHFHRKPIDLMKLRAEIEACCNT
jgi:CheY-like chemotaxis protein